MCNSLLNTAIRIVGVASPSQGRLNDNADSGADSMTKPFYAEPILNLPNEVLTRQYALSQSGEPLNQLPIEGRCRSKYVAPVPKSRKIEADAKKQVVLDLDQNKDGSSHYNPTPIINEIRGHIASWRSIPNPNDWGVTPGTQRLLQYWRSDNSTAPRLFYCQVEAVETAIWLAESRGRPTLWRRFIQTHEGHFHGQAGDGSR